MKKIKIIITIITFILSFFVHFGYNIFPNFITSIFFPVNESIFEHMKIIYTSVLLSSIIEYFMYKKENIKINNFILSIPISVIISINLYLSIYLLIDKFIPHNLFISITLLLLVYIFNSFISYKILNMKEIKYSKLIGIILIILSYIIFLYFTYYPLDNYLFLDTTNNSFGVIYLK